jgi:hypothetical protein
LTERSRPGGLSDERDLLDGWLDYYRATLLAKCDGLTGQQLIAAPASRRRGALDLQEDSGYVALGLGRLNTLAPISGSHGVWRAGTFQAIPDPAGVVVPPGDR